MGSMKLPAALLGSLLALAFSSSARAAEFFVAPDGNDQNAGTMAAPFATVGRAQMAAAPGDTVFLRGGVYRFSGTQATIGVELTKSGQSGKPMRYFAQPGELPIFDLFELKPQARVTGIDVRGNWIHVRGIEVRGVRQLIVGDSWGVRIRGDNNVIERLDVHDNEAPGIFIASGTSNLILNCDSHHNYDPLEQGGNADGFGCHSTGNNNILRGCRAYENSDDGYDFINAPGTCIAENSWAFRNGYIPDTNMTGANGAGFKSGGFGNPPNTPASGAPRHVVRGSLAFANRAIGFYANYHPGGIDFLNNTAFNNPANYDMRTGTGASSSHKLRNNVAVMPGRDIVSFTGGSDDANSWTLPVQVSADDFASLDVKLALTPREADGSLPNVPLARLVAGSDLVDRGEDVGLAYIGAAPDLGAYELGAEPAGNPSDAGMPDSSMPDASGLGDAAMSGDAAPPATAGAAAPTSPIGPVTPPGMPMRPAGSSGSAAGMPAAGAAGAAGAPLAGSAPAPAAMSGEPEAGGCSCRIGASPSDAGFGGLLLVALGWCLARRMQRS